MEIHRLLFTLKTPPYNLTQAQALDLLAFLLNCDRDHLWNHLSCPYWGSQQALKNTLDLIANHYPLAYILQRKYFLNHQFYIDERVLIPRDETEQLVILASQWLVKYPNSQIVDLGTGSGVIGLSLKKMFSQNSVIVTDNSWSALQVAQKNAQLLDLEVTFLLGNFLEPLQNLKIKPNLIVTNPPYVDSATSILPPSLHFEPQKALIAPNQGLYFYQKLFANWKTLIDCSKPSAMIMEFGYNQKSQIESLLYQYNLLQDFIPYFYRDWNHHWRYLVLEMRANANFDTNQKAH